MKNTSYLIGEVSKITGISKDTLHFYDKIGLLVPEQIDINNRYRYYSPHNLWQLDIITTCRKLNVPLETIRQILSLKDNNEILKLLMRHRDEAIRLSKYFQQVADDIVWYGEEHTRISEQKDHIEIHEKWLDEEIVVVGNLNDKIHSYHANLQSAVKEELRYAPSIRRKYGYFLDIEQIENGKVMKCREYLKLDYQNYSYINSENLYTLPSGYYATFTLRIKNEEADFASFLTWVSDNGKRFDMIFAEEIGLQLFPYIDDYYCEIKAHLVE